MEYAEIRKPQLKSEQKRSKKDDTRTEETRSVRKGSFDTSTWREVAQIRMSAAPMHMALLKSMEILEVEDGKEDIKQGEPKEEVVAKQEQKPKGEAEIEEEVTSRELVVSRVGEKSEITVVEAEVEPVSPSPDRKRFGSAFGELRCVAFRRWF